MNWNEFASALCRARLLHKKIFHSSHLQLLQSPCSVFNFAHFCGAGPAHTTFDPNANYEAHGNATFLVDRTPHDTREHCATFTGFKKPALCGPKARSAMADGATCAVAQVTYANHVFIVLNVTGAAAKRHTLPEGQWWVPACMRKEQPLFTPHQLRRESMRCLTLTADERYASGTDIVNFIRASSDGKLTFDKVRSAPSCPLHTRTALEALLAAVGLQSTHGPFPWPFAHPAPPVSELEVAAVIGTVQMHAHDVTQRQSVASENSQRTAL
jgi:hypothetical protein